VVSALLFASGRLAWMRQHWQNGGCVPLLSAATAAELARVLAYPKFRLTRTEREELLADYVPHCQIVERIKRCPHTCRDANDQPFLDLAQSGNADVLISGDKDLLALAGKPRFAIETPEEYRRRVGESVEDN
jgi:putative PIN family toxin of toxin-antitoxin system